METVRVISEEEAFAFNAIRSISSKLGERRLLMRKVEQLWLNCEVLTSSSRFFLTFAALFMADGLNHFSDTNV